MNLKSGIKKLYKVYSDANYIRYYRKQIAEKIKTSKVDIRRLSEDEIRDIDSYWERYHLDADHNVFRWFYSVNGIVDPKYIPEDIFAIYIKDALNTQRSRIGLSDKNLFEILFNGENQAGTIARCSNGVFEDKGYNPIEKEEVLRLISSMEKLVVKPTVESHAGEGIYCLPGSEAAKRIDEFGEDFIIQEVIRQHKSFSELNESSVNVVRISSLLLNGKVHILDSIIRIGAPGNFTDHKNIAVGIQNDGRLKEYGLTVKGEKVYVLPNGLKVDGHVLAGYREMVEMVSRLHPRVPQARLIGWDLTADEDGRPTIIEANFNFPGIMRGQDCNGPFFGDLTDEVLKFALGRKNG